MTQPKIRVLISKVGLDRHDLGAKVLVTALRDHGMEVVYLGSFQTPQDIVQTAMQEDVDVVGLSILSGDHMTHTPKVIQLLREKGLDDVPVVVGGIFPDEDIPALKEMGVAEVFVGSLVEPAVQYILNLGKKKQGEG